MKLSTRVRYGMRLMVFLAQYTNEGPKDLKVIAEREQVSMKYLSQIVIPLKSAGLVHSFRGAAGGYSLAGKPEEVTALMIYEAIDGPLSLIDCNSGESCDHSTQCAVRHLWGHLENALRDTLASHTLKDLAEAGASLAIENFIYSI